MYKEGKEEGIEDKSSIILQHSFNLVTEGSIVFDFSNFVFFIIAGCKVYFNVLSFDPYSVISKYQLYTKNLCNLQCRY